MVTRRSETSPHGSRVLTRDFSREKGGYESKGITEETPFYTLSVMIGPKWLIVLPPYI